MGIESEIEKYKLKCSLLGIEPLKITVQDNRVIADYEVECGEHVVVPSFVTELGSYIFCGLVDIKSISLPKELKILGVHSFDSCESLEEIYIPHRIMMLHSLVFNGCKNLRKVTIEADDIQINRDVFIGCNRLEEVNILGGYTYVCKGAFQYVDKINIDCRNIIVQEGVFDKCKRIRAPKRFEKILLEYKDKLELY